MHCGRLYQGKYVPPERSDGLLPVEEEAEEVAEDGEDHVEEIVRAETNDIDLD